MYVDNRKETGNSVKAVLLRQDGSRDGELTIDLKSIVWFFVALLGVSLATVGAFALAYSLYLAMFFK